MSGFRGVVKGLSGESQKRGAVVCHYKEGVRRGYWGG